MAKVISIVVVSLVALIGVGYFLTISGGKPIGTDLSAIGQGKPAIVLAYENHSPTGGEALNRLRKIRSDYDSRLNFVVAELGTPQGRQFANRYSLFDGQAVFLAGDGTPLKVTNIAENESELRASLDTMLAAVQ